MNFYEAVVRFEPFDSVDYDESRRLIAKENDKNPKGFVRDAFEKLNMNLGVKCDAKEANSFFFWDAEPNVGKLLLSIDTDKSNLSEAIAYIKSYMEENYDVRNVSVEDVVEITTARFHNLGEKGDNMGFIRRFRSDENSLGLDFRNNNQYTLKEEIIASEELTLEDALRRANELMANDSFVEELRRIYSDENEKKYYGNPVHYKIDASNMDVASQLASLLSQALLSNHRLEGSRLSKVFEIKEGCYSEDDLENLFENSQGNVIMMDLSGTRDDHGNYASTYEDVIEFIGRTVLKNHIKTLCIFIENTNHPGFAGKLMGRIIEEIDIIEIGEGTGNRSAAMDYILAMTRNTNYEVSESEIEEILPDKEVFTVGEIYEIYNKWFKNGLRNRIYKSYKYCNCMTIKDEDKKSEPYDELQNMIGLDEIKQTVDEIIDNARIQKLRSEMGMDSYKTSLHMVFTGNPGTAKTTVARLLTQILTKEDIVRTGRYVECGRADLVGKYVGWTAKAVKTKFREARGGVLFIDEAYSLVDSSNSFGDEAINTIVQEMENHREDVIVIFAGYPDKMETFLAKNEGLRSRIAFHLNFPDYNPTELVDILKLMASKKGYKVNDAVLDKCLPVFERAVKQKEFGNGRFARNLLEQAMVAQARRITIEYKDKKISRRALCTLKADDFNVNVSKEPVKNYKKIIGFAS